MKLRKWLTVLRLSLFKGTSSSSNTKAQCTGNSGEQIAAEFLKRAGWKIVSRNLRFGHDELDILALDKSQTHLVIIEVRTTASGGSPERTFTYKKKKALRRVARHLEHEAKRHRCKLRVDAITVRLSSTTPLIRHYEAIIPL